MSKQSVPPEIHGEQSPPKSPTAIPSASHPAAFEQGGTISRDGVSDKTEQYRGFIISWQEPPLTNAKWTANVASESPQLNALMGRNGAQVIDGHNRNEMLATAKLYVDSLLNPSIAATVTPTSLV